MTVGSWSARCRNSFTLSFQSAGPVALANALLPPRATYQLSRFRWFRITAQHHRTHLLAGDRLLARTERISPRSPTKLLLVFAAGIALASALGRFTDRRELADHSLAVFLTRCASPERLATVWTFPGFGQNFSRFRLGCSHVPRLERPFHRLEPKCPAARRHSLLSGSGPGPTSARITLRFGRGTSTITTFTPT